MKIQLKSESASVQIPRQFKGAIELSAKNLSPLFKAAKMKGDVIKALEAAIDEAEDNPAYEFVEFMANAVGAKAQALEHGIYTLGKNDAVLIMEDYDSAAGYIYNPKAFVNMLKKGATIYLAEPYYSGGSPGYYFCLITKSKAKPVSDVMDFRDLGVTTVGDQILMFALNS